MDLRKGTYRNKRVFAKDIVGPSILISTDQEKWKVIPLAQIVLDPLPPKEDRAGGSRLFVKRCKAYRRKAKSLE